MAVQIWRPSLFVLVSNVSDVFGASVLKSSLSHFVSGFSAESPCFKDTPAEPAVVAICVCTFQSKQGQLSASTSGLCMFGQLAFGGDESLNIGILLSFLLLNLLQMRRAITVCFFRRAPPESCLTSKSLTREQDTAFVRL